MPKSDAPNEDEVKKAAEMREWLEEKISETEMELTRLRDMQTMVDSILRKTSFVPATELRSSVSPAKVQTSEKTGTAVKSEVQAPPIKNSDEPRQLRRSNDGKLIATAFVTPEKIIVVPSSDVKVSQT